MEKDEAAVLAAYITPCKSQVRLPEWLIQTSHGKTYINRGFGQLVVGR